MPKYENAVDFGSQVKSNELNDSTLEVCDLGDNFTRSLRRVGACKIFMIAFEAAVSAN